MIDQTLPEIVWMPLLISLKVAFCATATSGLFALPAAYFIGRAKGALPALLDSLCALPLVLPPTVIGYYLIILIGRHGLLGPFLKEMGIQLIFTWEGAVAAAALVIFPLVYKSARAAFTQVDPHLEEAARTLGANELRVFMAISLPLARKGIFAGLMLAFARGMGEFGATLMVTGNIPGKTQTLSLAIYSAFQSGNDSKALMLAIFTSIVCASILAGAEFFLGRGK